MFKPSLRARPAGTSTGAGADVTAVGEIPRRACAPKDGNRKQGSSLAVHKGRSQAEEVFRLDRVNGSHHIFVHPRIPELLNLQDLKGDVKPYQLKQLLKLVQIHNLQLEDTL